MAVNRTFHRLLQPTDSPALEIWARSWLEVDERSAAAVLSRVPADLPHLERVRLRAGSTLYGDLLIAQPIHLYAEEGVQLVGQLRLDGGSSRGSGSSHKANFYGCSPRRRRSSSLSSGAGDG